MTRWRFELYRDGADEPFHSVGEEADAGIRDEVGLPLGLAVALRVALDDERVARIELQREHTARPGHGDPGTDTKGPRG